MNALLLIKVSLGLKKGNTFYRMSSAKVGYITFHDQMLFKYH